MKTRLLVQFETKQSEKHTGFESIPELIPKSIAESIRIVYSNQSDSSESSIEFCIRLGFGLGS